MKITTSLLKLALCAISLSFTLGSQAQSVNTATSLGTVTIVQPIELVPGKNAADSLKAMRNMVAVIRKMPGLVDDVVMDNKNPETKPSHVHVMRWKDQKSWEAMFGNAEFQKAIRENSPYFKIDAVGIYTPVK